VKEEECQLGVETLFPSLPACLTLCRPDPNYTTKHLQPTGNYNDELDTQSPNSREEFPLLSSACWPVPFWFLIPAVIRPELIIKLLHLGADPNQEYGRRENIITRVNDDDDDDDNYLRLGGYNALKPSEEYKVMLS